MDYGIGFVRYCESISCAGLDELVLTEDGLDISGRGNWG
jgi:hypothetical protein